MRLDDNEIKCVVDVCSDPYSPDKIVNVVLSINGKKIVVNKSITSGRHVEQFDKTSSVVDEVAKAIAVEALAASFSKLNFSSL